MASKYLTCICLLVFSISSIAIAQFECSHEIGAIVGPIAFQSDYGKRNDLKTNIGNTGFGIGIIDCLNFSDSRGYNVPFFNDHFKLRSELSYCKTNLNHTGQWVEGKPSLGKEQLKAMNGSTAVTNIGIQLEFFPWSIRDFTYTVGAFAPFISLGGQFSFYNAKAWSELGSLGSPLTTFPKFLTPTDDRPYGFSTENRTVWSIVSSMGTRYKLASYSDLMVDLRIQYYTSDWVDGLNPNPVIYSENRAKDYLIWFNVGYIYYLP
jgi:hypothetical protein